MKVYVIGSLRNPEIPEIARILREQVGCEVFDDWFAAGPVADDSWRDYEKARGHTYETALHGIAAQHVFNFDKHHLEGSDAAVLVLPAGRSAHLEAGWMLGRGKPVAILLDDAVRYDVMMNFASLATAQLETVINWLKGVMYDNRSKQAGIRYDLQWYDILCK